VVKSIVAIDGPRVRFTADASIIQLIQQLQYLGFVSYFLLISVILLDIVSGQPTQASYKFLVARSEKLLFYFSIHILSDLARDVG
jgi:hypothetical protein